jgi:GNAT superfamily N-acetyltransferase
MIRTSSGADAKRVIDSIVLGFSADPVVRWLFPEPQRFLAKFPTLARLYGGRAFEHGTAYHLDGYVGAALWLPPKVHPDEKGLTELFQEEFSGDKLEAVFALFEQMDAAHPDEPCYHLTFIAVDPSRQGKGYGSKILAHTLKLCDKENGLAYLESTNPANISLYLRHGFELVGNIQAGESPPLFPMIREPR